MEKKIKVNNKMQKNYTYTLSEPIGKNFRKDFKPELTPMEMIKLGAFGGKYFNDVAKTDEYPKSWFKDAKLSGIENPADPKLNYYGILSGSSLKEWKDNDWINKQDKRGWWEWYWRYYYGRRTEDDDRQINRWKNAERFKKSAITYHKKNKKHSLKLLQSALQWGYDTRSILKKSEISLEELENKDRLDNIYNW